MITDELRQLIDGFVEVVFQEGIELGEIQEEISKIYKVKGEEKANSDNDIEKKIVDFVRREIKYNSKKASKYAIVILNTFYYLRKKSDELVNKASLVQLSAEKTGLSELTVSKKIRYLVHRIVDYINRNDETLEIFLKAEYSRSVEILEIFYQRYMRTW